MFQAYSMKKSTVVNANDVTDLKDKYLCVFCRAEVTLKAINCPKTRPHFAKLPSIPHIDCPCNLFGSVSENITGYEKFDISDILNNSPLSIKSDKHSNNNNISTRWTPYKSEENLRELNDYIDRIDH